IPMDRDMAVIGPMARSALDLSLVLDVIAGPDPLEAGIAYRLALPGARHAGLKDFRVLVVETDPVLPPNKEIRRDRETCRQSCKGRRERDARERAVAQLC